MNEKLLLERRGRTFGWKKIKILEGDEEVLSKAFTPTSLAILRELAKSPNYPKGLAKILGEDEQKIYYHIRRLEEAGLIRVVKEERKRGGVCRFYSPVADAFGFEITESCQDVKPTSVGKEGELFRNFFGEFLGSGVFDGRVIVGSSLPHGPFLTFARDAHYFIPLAMKLGSLCEIPFGDFVKVDTEVGERDKKSNLIIIGGPLANLLTKEINETLKVNFRWRKDRWEIYSKLSKKSYREKKGLGLIAKVVNPWNEAKTIVTLAGLTIEGTQSCVNALVYFPEKVLQGYEEGREFYCVLTSSAKGEKGLRVLESHTL